MRYSIICVGKRTKDPILDAADDYLGRLQHYNRTEILRLKESNKANEGDAILAKVDSRDYLIALDEHGRERTTVELKTKLEKLALSQHRQITWVIGGTDGLSPAVLSRAQETWALSKLTLPHRMALMLLGEQLYRAHTIMRGEKYHRV